MSTKTERYQKCYFRISIAGKDPQTILLNLDTQTCPKTCANFLSFCTAAPKSPKTYHNTVFHRIIPGFMVQGGDYQNFDGTGGESFHGEFTDENFILKHNQAGVVSMANRGKNTAGSQFFITLGKASHLDGKHVAFGSVCEGMDVVEAMVEVERDERDRPVSMQKIVVTDCGAGDWNGGGECSDSSSCKEEESVERSRRKSSSRKKKKKKEHRRRGHDDDSCEDEEDDKKRSRRRKKHKSSKSSSRKKRSSSRKNEDTDDSESSSSVSSSSSAESRSKKRRRSKKSSSSKRKKTNDDEVHKGTSADKDNGGGDDKDNSSTDNNKRREKKHKKSHSRSSSSKRRTKRSSSRRHYSDEEDSSNSDSSSVSSHSRRHRRRRRDKKHSSSSHSKKKKNDRHTKEKEPTTMELKKKSVIPTFGMYGIMKQSDIHQSTKAKLSVEKWMAEIKGVPEGSSVAKWEMTEYFKEYVEDFNTATLPHQKYYDYGKWEMEEYNKKKGEAQSKKGPISDEFLHVEEMRRDAMEKKRTEMKLVISTMNHGKVKEMKRQAELKAELENAYRVGDQTKVKQIKRRLEPDEKIH